MFVDVPHLMRHGVRWPLGESLPTYTTTRRCLSHVAPSVASAPSVKAISHPSRSSNGWEEPTPWSSATAATPSSSSAGDLRRHDFEVAASPEEHEPAHAHVVGDKDKR